MTILNLLKVAQYLSNRIIYLMSKKSLHWRQYRLVTKRSHVQIENLVNHLKALILLSLAFLSVLVIFDLTYAIKFSMNGVKEIEQGGCLSDKVNFSENGCKASDLKFHKVL